MKEEDIKAHVNRIIGNTSVKTFNNEKDIMKLLNNILDDKNNIDNTVIDKLLYCIEDYLKFKEKMTILYEDYNYLCDLSEELKKQTIRKTDGVLYDPLFKVTNNDKREKYFLTRKNAEEYIKQKDNYTFNKVIEIEENDNIDLAKLLDIIKRNYKKEKNT